MALLHIQNLTDYVKYLEQIPKEVFSLMHDLLVYLTQFFRDADIFLHLEAMIIPQLLEKKMPCETFRIWVAGYSSGDEAYSIAILVHEAMRKGNKECAVQIFATDINIRALSVGRNGHYALGSARHISANRLKTYFTADPDCNGYRIQTFIREMLVFSEHDVTEALPFTRIDLRSYRNVMVYMEVDAQADLMRLFHHALRPKEALVLGTSEDIGEGHALVTECERNTKIYRHKANHPGVLIVSSNIQMPAQQSPAWNGQCCSLRRGVRAEAALRLLRNYALVQRLDSNNALVHIHSDMLYQCWNLDKILKLAPSPNHRMSMRRMARADYRLCEHATGYEVIEAVRSRFGAALRARIISAIQLKPLQSDTLLVCTLEQVKGSSA